MNDIFWETSCFPLAQNWRQNLRRTFFLMIVLHNFWTEIFSLFFLLQILHYNDFIFRFDSLHYLKTGKFFIHGDFQGCISWCHFAEIMVFSHEEKAVIENDSLERGWNAYKICKEQATKVVVEFWFTYYWRGSRIIIL